MVAKCYIFHALYLEKRGYFYKPYWTKDVQNIVIKIRNLKRNEGRLYVILFSRISQSKSHLILSRNSTEDLLVARNKISSSYYYFSSRENFVREWSCKLRIWFRWNVFRVSRHMLCRFAERRSFCAHVLARARTRASREMTNIMYVAVTFLFLDEMFWNS